MANRLEKEDSPYLYNHKDDLVDWYPWSKEAFKKAEAENKAIFISIGYSSCHWCHVMQEKVFNNKECADILNESFVSIKVDKEERPDIDKYYQEVYRLLNRRAGGWPTSIFATPQNKPFYAGTYIPPQSQQGSIEGMGFLELARLIGKKVSNNDADILKNADEIESFLNYKERPKEATVLKEDFVKNFMLQVKNNYETKYGGFSIAPKFPSVATLSALLTIDKLYDDRSAKAMLVNTLENMKKGGMYDIVDGGFCRYSVDDKWSIPHFEKMLYDNALLAELYLDTYLAYKNSEFLNIAKDIVDFWINYMSEDSLFYSASDADGKNSEGEYYLYDYDEVYNELKSNGFDNIESILNSLNITKDGNFEGKNIVRLENNIDNFEEIRKILIYLRKDKEFPFVDKKIQTSWSSMMIKTLFKLSAADSKYMQQAINSLTALLDTMYIDDKLYHSTLIHKKPKVEAFLEDYAYLAQALLSAFKYTQDESYLIQAQKFANIALEKFYDSGDWNFSKGEFEISEDIADATYMSSVNIMIDVLITLTTLLEDDKYSHFAFKTLEYNSYNLGRKPVFYPYMLKQMLRYLKTDRIIKSSKDNLNINLLKLSMLHYPFIEFKADSIDGFMICADKSCFANIKNIEDIDKEIEKTLS